MRVNLPLIVVVILLAAAGIALFPSRRRIVAYVSVIGLFALVAVAPAVAGFTANPAGHAHPAPTTPFTARTMPAMTLGTPNCQWAGANIQVNATALGGTYSWIQNTQLLRSTNGGAYSQSALGAYNVSSLSDTSITNQPADVYTYKFNTLRNSWTGADSATVTSTSCVNRIDALQPGTTTASMKSTNGVAVDSSGNVAFTDTGGHRVGFVPAVGGSYFGQTMLAGYMYAIAGTGTAGFTGDASGAATAGRVNSPEGVAFDQFGDVYFADTGSHAVRVIDRSVSSAVFFGATAINAGQMVSVAGIGGTSGNTGDGAASTSSKLSSPKGVAFDSNGDLIISDTGNNRLRMVTIDSNNHYGASPAMNNASYIWNLAGTAAGTSGSTNANPATSASFSGPQQIQLDSSGNIYVADTANAIVRKIPTSGATTTIAGQAGLSGTTGDGGVATSAKLSSAATGVAVDANNNVYIADSTNSNVRAVCQKVGGCTLFGKAVAQGNIDSVVGTGSNGYTGEGYPVSLTLSGTTTMTTKLSAPKGVFFDRTGSHLFIADTGNDMIRKVMTDTSSGQFTSGLDFLHSVAGNGGATWVDQVPAASAALTSPEEGGVDSNGNYVFADKGDNRIREYIANTGYVATIMGTGAVGSSGDGGWSVLAKVTAPEGATFDANGVVYVTDTSNQKIRAICPYNKGSNCTVLGVTVAPGQPQPVAGGSLSSGACADGVVALNSACHLNTPKGVEVGSNGDLYIANTANDSIKWVPNSAYGSNAFGKTTPVTQYAMYSIYSTASSAPADVGVDSSHNVYFADAGGIRIKQVARSSGSATNVAGTGSAGHSGDGGAATSAAISAAVTGITVDGSTIYIADNQLYIRRFSVGGNMYAVGGTGSAGIAGDYAGATSATMVPFGISARSSGDIYFSGGTTTNVQVRKIKGPAAS